MTINKLTASFGKLNGDTLELHEGLNVICAPNESGKSTWCAFIRAMLYGVDSAERRKGAYIPDKNRYAPWSGAVMQGEMQLTAGGKDVTITRSTKLKTAPMREFSAVYTGTGVAVEGLNSSNAGELLTGVSADVFRRSAFIEQGGIAISGSPELEKRISAIVSTGDEGASYSEADEQLRAWQRARRYNRRGRLPELESAIDEKHRMLGKLKADAEETERLQAQLDDCRKECERLEAGMMESRKRERLTALSELHDMRARRDDAEKAHELAAKRLKECSAALESSVIHGKAPDEVSDDIEKSLKLKEISEKKISGIPQTVLLVLGIALAILSAFMFPKSIVVYGYIAAALLCVGSVIMSLSVGRQRMNAGEAKADRLALLEKYGAQTEDDIKDREQEYQKMYAALTDAEVKENEAAAKLAESRREYELFESNTVSKLDFTSGSSEAADMLRQLNEARLKCERLSVIIAEKRGALGVSGDPLVIGTELKSMEAEHEELEAEYDALSLAISTLREADAEIQSRFSPALGRKAAEYMSIVTDGRYEGVLINRDLTASTRLSDDSIARSSGYLSAGTLDLMYLAVRLAVCELALPEGGSCPLILDDTLVNFDAERTEKAMKLLGEIAKERQVILFTCK